MRTRWVVTSAALVGIALGFVLGHFALKNSVLLLFISSESRERSTNYKFVSPLLECNTADEALPGQVAQVKQEISNIIDREKSAGVLKEGSVYYRDLSNGPRFTVNGDLTFSPSSLLKVPLMMAVYKEAQDNPSFLSERIEYDGGTAGAAQDITVGDPITPGTTYSVDELVRHMIVNSDNNAAILLYEKLGYEKTADTYKDLALDPPTEKVDYSVTVASYATFFRLLYNATYIDSDYSERALKNLSESEFKDGLVAGVGDGVVVSHKFGERHYETEGIQQLHDCGVVYKPQHPYILCIMTRGKDTTSLSKVIKEISSAVYTSLN